MCFLCFLPGSRSEDGIPFTQSGQPQRGARPYPTTQDTERNHQLLTTAPPLNVPNHHPLFDGFLVHQPQPAQTISERQHDFEDSGGAGHDPTMSALNTPITEYPPTHDTPSLSNVATTAVTTASTATKQVENPGVENGVLSDGKKTGPVGGDGTLDILTQVMHTSAPPPRTFTPNFATPIASQQLDIPTTTTPAPSAMTTPSEKDAVSTVQSLTERELIPSDNCTSVSPRISVDMDEETTTTTITTTTITTTIQTPGKTTL